jgi:hypothetical protein
VVFEVGIDEVERVVESTASLQRCSAMASVNAVGLASRKSSKSYSLAGERGAVAHEASARFATPAGRGRQCGGCPWNCRRMMVCNRVQPGQMKGYCSRSRDNEAYEAVVDGAVEIMSTPARAIGLRARPRPPSSAGSGR